MGKATKAEVTEAIEALKKILKPGDTVYGIVRSVSRSGMSRTMDFYAIVGGEPWYLTGYMATLGIGSRRKNGIHVVGCGMDMIFACVYDLARRLWPEGGVGQSDGGYLLRHKQL